MNRPKNETASTSTSPQVSHSVHIAVGSLPTGTIAANRQSVPHKDAPTGGMATRNPAPNATAPSAPSGSFHQILNCR